MITLYIGICTDVAAPLATPRIARQRDLSRAAYALVRRVAWERYGTTSGIRFLPNGKPYIADGAFEFSLSHTSDAYAVAISNAPCGVDIERIRAVDMRIARRYTPNERAHCDSPFDVLSTWTRKEAYYKMAGGRLLDVDTTTSHGEIRTWTLPRHILSAAGDVTNCEVRYV